MQECFEKIKERLERERDIHIRAYDVAIQTHERAGYASYARACDEAIEIVNQVAKEYVPDTNVGNKDNNQSITNNNQFLTNDGWIPVSSGKMPENGRRCWVTYEWANGTLHVDEDYLIEGKWFETEDEAVKAWMYNYVEKPEPYQPKGE